MHDFGRKELKDQGVFNSNKIKIFKNAKNKNLDTDKDAFNIVSQFNFIRIWSIRFYISNFIEQQYRLN